MELVKSAGKRTSFLSEVLYNIFNIGLAAGTFLLVFYEVPILAYALIVLSKWRVFAVRPRFWWANIKANLLDFLLGVSVVTMMWQAFGIIWLQIIITVLFALWLTILKPRSDQSSVLAQAGIAQFMAITALFSISYDWSAWLVVISMWLIGFISAQHALSSFEDASDVTLMSLVWALIVAEIGWLAYSWSIAYSVAPDGVFKIPQIAVIITLVGYFAISAYGVYAKKRKLRLNDVTFPALFSGSIILAILLFFNNINRG